MNDALLLFFIPITSGISHSIQIRIGLSCLHCNGRIAEAQFENGGLFQIAQSFFASEGSVFASYTRKTATCRKRLDRAGPVVYDEGTTTNEVIGYES